MAEYLASIFGTEKDKVNCSFYFKIGACRHGDKCSRIHNKPVFSQTILLQNLYIPPLNLTQDEAGQSSGGATYLLANPDGTTRTLNEIEMQEHYDEFYDEVFSECHQKYGQIEEMNVCDNLGDHLTGNVYIKFRREEDAERAVNELNNRWFNARPIHAELSPVTDFREACCRQYEVGECTRGGFCNFMHLKPISRDLRRKLYKNASKTSAVPRSRSRSKDRGGRSSHRGGGDRDRGRGHRPPPPHGRDRDRRGPPPRRNDRNGGPNMRYDAPFPGGGGGNAPFPFPMQ